jgi:hypothetical protein
MTHRRTIIAAAAVALVLGAGGGALAAGALEPDDERVVALDQGATPAVAPATAGERDAGDADDADDLARPGRLVVDDGIPAAEARDVARRAVAHTPGRAVSVDRDDGRYEVDVQRPDGAVVEVRLDGSRRVLGVDLDG